MPPRRQHKEPMELKREVHPAWPDVLVPAEGCLPPSTIVSARERVLHLALRTRMEQQPGLARALRSIAREYAEVDWIQVEATEGTRAVGERLLQAARALRPTLVWMQVQRGGVIDSTLIARLRAACEVRAVIVNWDGDQHYEPTDPARRWFVDLGHACDASLVVNTRHPFLYRELGVRHPGYLQIGIDETIYAPAHPDAMAPSLPSRPIVFFASCYGTDPAYAPRHELVARLGRRFEDEFAVHGSGWSPAQHARPFLRQADEAAVYDAARAAISMSIRNDLPRYTSDRLFRALATGAYVLVERFPDAAGLGLSDGVNCRFWSDEPELRRALYRVLADADPDYRLLRDRAASLAHTFHTWSARMGELLAIVDVVRGESHRSSSGTTPERATARAIRAAYREAKAALFKGASDRDVSHAALRETFDALAFAHLAEATCTLPCAAVAFWERMGYTVRRLESGASSHNNDVRPLARIPSALAGRQFTQVVSRHAAPVEVEFLSAGKLFVLVGTDWEGYGPASTWLREVGVREPLPLVETLRGTAFEVWSLLGETGERFVIPTQVMLVSDHLERRE